MLVVLSCLDGYLDAVAATASFIFIADVGWQPEVQYYNTSTNISEYTQRRELIYVSVHLIVSASVSVCVCV